MEKLLLSDFSKLGQVRLVDGLTSLPFVDTPALRKAYGTDLATNNGKSSLHKSSCRLADDPVALDSWAVHAATCQSLDEFAQYFD